MSLGHLIAAGRPVAFLSASAQATPAVSVTLDAAATPVPPSGTPMSTGRSTAEM